MSREEEIVSELNGRFPFLTDKIYVQRDKRIFTKPLSREEFRQTVAYVHGEMNFRRASHVVGTDDGDTFGLLYILSGSDNILLILRESVPKTDPTVKSVSDMYPSIVLHERELVDLFGITVEGLPEGPRYPLPDGWPEGNYPLRKDWDPKRFNKDTMIYEKPAKKEAVKDE